MPSSPQAEHDSVEDPVLTFAGLGLDNRALKAISATSADRKKV